MSISSVRYECCTDGTNWRLVHPTDLSNPALLVRQVMPDGSYGKPMLLHEFQRLMVVGSQK